jgi:hypothetical protein
MEKIKLNPAQLEELKSKNSLLYGGYTMDYWNGLSAEAQINVWNTVYPNNKFKKGTGGKIIQETSTTGDGQAGVPKGGAASAPEVGFTTLPSAPSPAKPSVEGQTYRAMSDKELKGKELEVGVYKAETEAQNQKESNLVKDREITQSGINTEVQAKANIAGQYQVRLGSENSSKYQTEGSIFNTTMQTLQKEMEDASKVLEIAGRAALEKIKPDLEFYKGLTAAAKEEGKDRLVANVSLGIFSLLQDDLPFTGIDVDVKTKKVSVKAPTFGVGGGQSLTSEGKPLEFEINPNAEIFTSAHKVPQYSAVRVGLHGFVRQGKKDGIDGGFNDPIQIYIPTDVISKFAGNESLDGCKPVNTKVFSNSCALTDEEKAKGAKTKADFTAIKAERKGRETIYSYVDADGNKQVLPAEFVRGHGLALT